MRTVLLLTVVFAACKPKPAAVTAPAAAPAPNLNNGNVVEKYVGGLQNEVKKTQDVKAKADAAGASADEANKVSE